MAGPWEDYGGGSSSVATRPKDKPPGPWDDFALPSGSPTVVQQQSPSPSRVERAAVAQPVFSNGSSMEQEGFVDPMGNVSGSLSSLPVKAPAKVNTQNSVTPQVVPPRGFNPESSDYDYATATAAGLGPDGTGENKGHWGSVAPASKADRERYSLPDNSYVILKGRKHETWDKAVQAEIDRGSEVLKIGPRYFSVPKGFQQPAEMRSYEPTLFDQFRGLFPANKDKASNEVAARQIAKRENIPVTQVYREAGGSRPIFNPEGRAPIGAAVDTADTIVTDVIPSAVRSIGNAGARTIRGGNISAPGQENSLDKFIKRTEPPKRTGPGNFDAFENFGDGLGYSLTTLVASASAAAAATPFTGPIGGVAAGMTAAGTIAYRSSKDQFLDNVKENLNKQSKKMFGRDLSPDEWKQASIDFDGAATKYSAWEAIPEAISNAIFLKAFAKPIVGAVRSRLDRLAPIAASQAAEQATETITLLGQNKIEFEAGLTTEQLDIKEAFRRQFAQTLLTSGTMAAGAKAKEAAQDFYINQVEPRVSPGSALARAIRNDLDMAAFNPESIRQEAVRRLNPDNAQLEVRNVGQQGGNKPWEDFQTPAPTEAQSNAPWEDFRAANNPPPLSPIESSVVQSEPIPPGIDLTQSAGEPTLTGEPMTIGPDDRADPPMGNVLGGPIESNDPPMGDEPRAANIERPETVAIYNGLIDAMNGGYMGQKQAMKEFQRQYGLVEVKNNEAVLSAKGQQLIEQLNPRGMGAKPLTTQEADDILNQFVAANQPEQIEPVTIAPIAPTTQTQAEPTEAQRVFNQFLKDGGGDDVQQVSTTTGRKIDTVLYLAEMDELSPAGGDLQPRDRSRQSSDQQIQLMANQLDPARLGESAEADRGAPIVGDDFIIESGNGRVQAIKRAYEQVPERAQAYRDFLANKYGFIDAQKMRMPVLVRVRMTALSPDERRQFVQEANQSATMQFSATEKALIDQTKLGPQVMGVWRGGEVTDAANRDFVRSFIQNVIPQAEQNSVMDANGNLSLDGKRRIEAAMLGKAFGDASLLARIFESNDNNIRSIGGALLDVSGDWMNMRQAGVEGRMPERFDVTPQLVDAVRILDGLRETNRKLSDFLGTQEMFEQRDPATEAFLRGFFNAKLTRAVGRDQVYDLLKAYADAAVQQSDESLFGDLSQVQPTQIIETQTEARNAKNAGSETGQLFEVAPRGAETAGTSDARGGQEVPRRELRRGGQESDRPSNESNGGQQDGQNRSRTRRDNESTGQEKPARSQKANNQSQAETDRVEEDNTNGRTSGQDDDNPLPRQSQREASSQANTGKEENQRFRGTTRSSLLYQVSFTNRQSIYRNAFVELGYDPTQAELLPPARQFTILSEGLKNTYGLAFVQRTDPANLREAIDQLLDAYRGLQLMAYVTDLPSKAIGLEGTLGLVLRRQVEYLGAYYPGGGNIEGTRTTGPTIALPKRSNSFAHEWGHAFDYWMLDKINNEQGTLSESIRKGDALSTQFPESIKDAYVLMMRSLFFDRGLEAAQIMELEKKIETAKTDAERQKLQAKLDQVLSGASKSRSTKSQYYEQQKEFVSREGGELDYWTKPTEMLARAFEAYISFKVEGAGGTTEFIGKGTEAYQSDAISRLELTFPKDADRFNIYRAFDLLFDAVRSEALLNPTGEAAATMPDDVVLSNPAIYFRDVIDTSEGTYLGKIFKNEREELQRQRNASKRQAERPSDNKTVFQRIQDATNAIAHTNRGVLLSIEGRYKKRGNAGAAKAIWQITKRIATDPGAGRETFKSGVFNEAVERETYRFENRLDRIIKDHDIQNFTEEELDQLRDVLTAISDEPMRADAKITAAAAPLRILLNDLHGFMTQAGVDVGYVEQGYLTRILDEPIIMDNPGGFVQDATKVYEVVFENTTPDLEGAMTPDSVEQDLGVVAGILKKLREAGIRYNKDSRFAGFAKTIKQMRKLAGQLRKALSAGDADQIDDARAAYASFIDEWDVGGQSVAETIGQARELAKEIWSDKAANDWLSRILYGSPAGWDSNSPSANFLKQRKLPPEADKLLTKWYIADPSETARTYLRGAVRKSEYNRRFGKMSGDNGNTKMDTLFENLRLSGVSGEDVAYIKSIVDQETGNLRTSLPRGTERLLNNVQTIGTMALLGRVVLTSLAEPIAVGFQTGKALDGFVALAATIREIVPTASVREKRALARALGVVASPHTQDILANRFGGQYREDPKISKASSRYYARIGLTGLTNAQRRSAMQLGIVYFVEMAETLNDPDASAQDKAAARRELVDFGLQRNDIDEFATWMMQFTDRMPDVEEITDVNGQLTEFGMMLSTSVGRLVNQAIQNPKGVDRPFAANTTIGRMVYGLLSFNMAFFRNIMVKSWKMIAREAEEQGAQKAAWLAVRAVAFPALSLYAGHFMVTMLREALLNPDKWDEEEKKGNLYPYLVGLAFSRSGFTGLLDPFYNAVLSLKYERDLSNLLIGPVSSFFAVNAQRLLKGFMLPNSDKNNKVETQQLKAAYEMTFQPVMAYGVGALPGGPLLGAGYGVGYGYLSSPAFKAKFAEFFVGPKDTDKKKDAGIPF